MKKNVTVRVLCLVVAIVVLGSAVTVAAFMGSPYEILKKAALDAVTYRNATVEGNITMTFDGAVVESSKMLYVQGDEAFLNYNFDKDGNITGFDYSDSGLKVATGYLAEDGAQWYFGNVNSSDDGYRGGRGGLSMLSSEDRNSPKMRFMELVLDALVGDLKNNITMSSEDNIRLISGTLTESQVPELVKAGIDLICEQQGSYYYFENRDLSFDGKEYLYEERSLEQDKHTVTTTTWKQLVRSLTPEEAEAFADGTFYDNYDQKAQEGFCGFSSLDGVTYLNEGSRIIVNESTAPLSRADLEGKDPLDIPMKNLTINYIHGEAKVDAVGNLLSVAINGTFTITNIVGDIHTAEFKVTANFSDIGVSDPVCPIPGAQQLLTPEYLRTLFENEYVGFYFTLNEDGSINGDSITTTYPGELDRQTEIRVEKELFSTQTLTSSYTEEVIVLQDSLPGEEELFLSPAEMEFINDED